MFQFGRRHYRGRLREIVGGPDEVQSGKEHFALGPEGVLDESRKTGHRALRKGPLRYPGFRGKCMQMKHVSSFRMR